MQTLTSNHKWLKISGVCCLLITLNACTINRIEPPRNDVPQAGVDYRLQIPQAGPYQNQAKIPQAAPYQTQQQQATTPAVPVLQPYNPTPLQGSQIQTQAYIPEPIAQVETLPPQTQTYQASPRPNPSAGNNAQSNTARAEPERTIVINGNQTATPNASAAKPAQQPSTANRAAPQATPLPRPAVRTPIRPETSVQLPQPSRPSASVQRPTPAPPMTTGNQRLSPAVSVLVKQANNQLSVGKTDQAAATLERALRISPKSALLWLRLAEVHRQSGNKAQAQSMARKAQTLAPNDPAIQARAKFLLN